MHQTVRSPRHVRCWTGGQTHPGQAHGAAAELQAKQESNAALLGIGSIDRRGADLDRCTIVSRGSASDVVVTAAVQVVETFDADARLCRGFARRHALSELTPRIVSCGEFEAWRSTAVGLHLAKAPSVYRGPAGRTNMFMTFHDVSLGRV